FSLLVPKVMGKVERHADVEGGFYMTERLNISYDYWSYAGTPNWLQGEFSKPIYLNCSKESKNTRTWQTRIYGNRATLQQCSETDKREGFHYIYYVTFPKIKVFNGEYFEFGMFSLTVEYKNKFDLPVAAKIIHSLNFKK